MRSALVLALAALGGCDDPFKPEIARAGVQDRCGWERGCFRFCYTFKDLRPGGGHAAECEVDLSSCETSRKNFQAERGDAIGEVSDCKKVENAPVGSNPAIREAEDLVKLACACPDLACAQAAEQSLELYRTQGDGRHGTKQDQKRIVALAGRLRKCVIDRTPKTPPSP
jgi:hypothetical protein